ncbi:MAG: class I SAM-dependent methyltransferase [Caulobacteraceae bacterium]
MHFRRHLRGDNRQVSAYLRDAARPKLHIGAGPRRLPGWLNTDIQPFRSTILLDASRRFPFSDATFYYVFSEHMIEHLSFTDGQSMLRECYRVMCDGGRIRVATPNLTNVAALYSHPHSDVEEQYLSWFRQTFLPPDWPESRSSLLSAFFHFWGHKYIYDEPTLAGALSAAGFRSITRFRLNESNDENFTNLENTERYPDGLLDFESIALEGEK